MTIIPQCFDCRHFRVAKAPDPTVPLTCDAFPDGAGIPHAILLARHDHREPFPGDRGIRFEPIDSDRTSPTPATS